MIRLLTKSLLTLIICVPLAANAAIALDTKGSGTATGDGSSNNSVAITVGSGSNRYLIFQTGTLTAATSNVRYNGVAMTSYDCSPGGAVGYGCAYVLPAPTSGTNNLTWTTGVGVISYYCYEVVSGADQSTTPDNHTAAEGGGTSATATLTPVANNAWVWGGIIVQNSALTYTGTGMNNNVTQVASRRYCGDSTVVATPTAKTMSATHGAAASAVFMISLAPAADPPSLINSIIGLVRALWIY